MAELITYREAVSEGIAREMRRDSTVVCLGEDIGAAEGVFKTTTGLFAEFGAERVWDTPISEQAIVGAALGAAIFRPGTVKTQFSTAWECWAPKPRPPPLAVRITSGTVTWPPVI